MTPNFKRPSRIRLLLWWIEGYWSFTFGQYRKRWCDLCQRKHYHDPKTNHFMGHPLTSAQIDAIFGQLDQEVERAIRKSQS